MTYGDNPNQKLLDRLTRMDELQIITNGLLKEILISLGGSTNLGLSSELVEQKRQLEAGGYVPYDVKTFDMTTAVTNKEVIIQGNNIIADSDGSLSGVTVRFNNQNNPEMPLIYFLGKKIPFSKLFLTWTAQVGKTLYIAAGRMGESEFDLRSGKGIGIVPGETTLYSSRPAGTVNTSRQDCRNAQKTLIYFASTLDAAVNVQLFGNISDSATGLVLIAGVTNIAIGSVTAQYTSIGLSDIYWHPYIGVQITLPGAAPAAGTLTITSVVQQ